MSRECLVSTGPSSGFGTTMFPEHQNLKDQSHILAWIHAFSSSGQLWELQTEIKDIQGLRVIGN